MSRMETFFKNLHKAEFESGEYEDEANPREVVKLLKRAAGWKNYENVYDVCVYLGAECDDRTDTLDGCKEIIQEDIEYWKDQY